MRRCCWSMLTQPPASSRRRNWRLWAARSTRFRSRRALGRWPTATGELSFSTRLRWAMRGRAWWNRSFGWLYVCGSGGRSGRRGGNRLSQAQPSPPFYYAVEPFSDNEIADILAPSSRRARSSRPSRNTRRVRPSRSAGLITNRNLHKVQLLAAGSVMGARGTLGSTSKKLLGADVPGRRHAGRKRILLRPIS